MSDWFDEHIRTLRELSGLDEQEARRLFDRELHVCLDPTLRNNRSYRMAFAFAVTLLTRIFPQTRFDDLGQDAYLITPWTKRRSIEARFGSAATILLFGRQAPPIRTEQMIRANLHDWHVYIDSSAEPDPQEEWNPVLALVTACYAAARVTKVLLGDAVDGPEMWRPFSILDFEGGRVTFDWSERVECGEVYFAGIGAVGTSALYALAAHNALSSNLVLVDPEQVDVTNLGRYVLYDAGNVGAWKASAAETKLRELGLANPIEAIREKFEPYFDRKYLESAGFRVERLISAPDRRSIRRQFQSKLPRRLWDASTGPDQIVLHHNSFERERACLECVYPEIPEENAHFKHVAEILNVPAERVVAGDEISAEDAAKIIEKYPHMRSENLVGRPFDSVFRELCSAGQLRGISANVLAPFPFISGLAGVLLYFEFLKSLRPDVFGPFQKHNYVQLNPMFPPNPDCRELRLSRPDCSCQRAQVRNLFSKIWFG